MTKNLIFFISQKLNYFFRYSFSSVNKNIFTEYYSWINNLLDFFPISIQRNLLHTLKDKTRFILRLHSFDMLILNEIYILDLYSPKKNKLKIKNNDIIDIGAHIGIYSIFAAKKYKPKRIFAFEPYEPNYKLLQKNIALNKNISRIFPIKQAVASKKEKKLLYINSKNTGGHSFYPYLINKKQKKIRVNTLTLDDIFKKYKISHCSILKLDCEGAEYDILKAASDETLKKIQLIILEYHPNYSLEKLQSFLKNKGFIISHGRSGFPILFAIKR